MMKQIHKFINENAIFNTIYIRYVCMYEYYNK